MTKSTLSYLYERLKKEDEKAGEKILDLLEKMEAGQKRIGFAGHFSAGKSTLINTLLERELLPSSPIPTSANIVHLSEGKPHTTAYFKESPPSRFEGDLPFETVKALCKDGGQITRVDITREGTGLPLNVTLLDTPGVDSTNDADRLITESSLHTMDFLYYVMDYNHVQSEVNLQFLLEMQERNTPFSIVINQIDKHSEDELPFDSFKQSVSDSLAQWGIIPESIYFVSLKDFNFPRNEWESLNEDFRRQFTHSENADQPTEEKAGQILTESLRQKLSILEEEWSELDESIQEIASSVPDQAKHHYRSFEEVKEEAETLFQEQVRSFIKNAYLMPGRLRDDAESFLHSTQPGFKVGFLFSKNKTEVEKNEREQTFYDELCKVVEQNLVWPLRERMFSVMETLDLQSHKVQEVVQKPFRYDRKRLHELIEPGAQVTGAYVLRYTEQVANDLKSKMKAHIEAWQKALLEELNQESESKESEHSKTYDAVQKMKALEEQQECVQEDIHHLKQRYQDWLDHPAPTEDILTLVETDLQDRRNKIISMDPGDVVQEEKEYKQEENVTQDPERVSTTKGEVLETMDHLVQTAGDIDGLEELFRHLEEKRNRLEKRRYTVALFGAFSAGKSSFANALLGEPLLPSSPNPTTATINKISPPEEGFDHKSVKVEVKRESELLDDLYAALGKRKAETDSLDHLYHEIERMNDESWNDLNQKNRSFIRAFQEGYSEMKERIGTTFRIEEEHFESYVSDERYSCFIESMELFYDSYWTRKGITLVDTPGADSVNARHTDVSFEYIKDADAVLFVTYYNHPFSKADQSFLTQLGRVKDSFQMDKMFFLINASDLASSDEELQSVESYVREQLQNFQIRNPRLFSLSSKKALERKRSTGEAAPGLQRFEQQFEAFLDEELQQVIIESMWEDMDHIVETMKSFIDYARLNEGERAEQLSRLRSGRQSAEELLKKMDPSSEYNRIQNKTEKQVHYVHERMMLNGNDLFKQHINPATVSGKQDTPKEELKRAIRELDGEVDYERKQELRAVSLRLERMVEERMQEEKERITKELRAIQDHLSLQMPEWESVQVPSFHLQRFFAEQEIKQMVKMFRNTRAFFEKNEKEALKDAMLESLSPKLKRTLNKEQTEIESYYQRVWDERYDYCQKQWLIQVDATFERLVHRLEHSVPVENLEAAYDKVKTLVVRSDS
ncbi:dynamin family protein [Halobacillus litoralis]|uniref:dynamin family protein n=1 Tax=Halobacillus litoralis TaxID=45668 RepID=UPI001CD5ED23|nr:dynamin family protein [Halobacillus litoralis]MCA0968978.1 dynamin family protein [Halobacillus litoralis]